MTDRPVLYNCRHCQRPVRSRQTRGLCWGCRMKPEIRQQYSPLGNYGEAGARQGKQDRNRRPPAHATACYPGTPERAEVYAKRIAAGEHLWHHRDAPNYQRSYKPMLTTIFFDMDGVMVDFLEGACKAHGIAPPERPAWDFWKPYGIQDDKFWTPLCNEQFWASLKPMADGINLFHRCVKEFGPDRVGILSSGQCPGSVEGKRQWLRKHLPEFASCATFAAAKHKSSSPQAILVDDHEPNILHWESEPYCGHGILYPAWWNSRWTLLDGGRVPTDMIFARIVTAVNLIYSMRRAA